MSSTITLPLPSCIIDFAVFSSAITSVGMMNSNDHVIILDSLAKINWLFFKNLFYNLSNTFSLNPSVPLLLLPYISFDNRRVNTTEFCLTEVIFENIETDLGISRIMFSPCTNIALNKQLNAINTLADIIPTSTMVCSMTWADIVNTVKSCPHKEVTFVLTVCFISPTPGVYPTCVKFTFIVDVTDIA
jgi:hypothetical protein